MQRDNDKERFARNFSHQKVMMPYVQVDGGPGLAEPTVSGWANYASWLSDDILLIVGWFHAKEMDSPQVLLSRDDRLTSLEARCISYPRPDHPGVDPRAGKVITARFLNSEDAREPLGSVVVQTDTTSFALAPLDLSQAMTDLQTLVRGGLVWLDAEKRAEVMEFLASTLKEHRGTTNGLRLSKNLFLIREALRERLPRWEAAPDRPQGLYVDHFVACDERSFYIRGWGRDEEAKVAHLTAVSPEGIRVELLQRVFRFTRLDVVQFYGSTSSDQLLAKDGFIAYFELEAPSYLSTGWTLEMRNTVGTAVEVDCPPVVRDTSTARNEILASLPLEILPNESLMADHVFPALSRLQERLREGVEAESTAQYGTPPESPDISIIVPLYKRIDFLEQQLAQFVHDPEIHRADLIYVLDSPELARNLREEAAQLYQLYRIPFRIVILRRNAGFSAANNIGVSFARGRLLLLLNSDILPDKPGWLKTMTAFYDSTPGIGALGPKLLYEDDTLQHAGMYFQLPLNTALANLWQNLHYFKGLHRQLPAANVTRPVPALTGACLTIDKELYVRVGGFQEVYLQGDHEDSDLCLRLIEAGHENWYLPDVELYHLEAQSYPSPLRGLTALYNRWLHTRLWKERIEAVMARYPFPAVVASELALENTQDHHLRKGER